MKTKWIFMVLAGLMVCTIFATSQGADKFYYGGFHAQDVLEKCPVLSDSLRFNLVFLMNLDSSNIDSLGDNSLKGVAEQPHDVDSPTYWSRASYYTLWEAEGFPGSRKGFSYSGGTQVCDPEAHPYPCSGIGWNAMRFCNPLDSGVVQTGPNYRQYSLGLEQYNVDFNLKFSGNRSIPTKPVCNILVAADGSTIQESTLVVGDFPESGYGEFQLQYTLSDFKSTQFKIYWHGVDSLYVDYVEVGNQDGYDLMLGLHDQDILNYVQQSWVDTSVVYRWYMRDQPQSIDCYMPYAHIDSILRDSLPLVPGAQFTCYFGDTNQIHDYLIRTDPVEYMVDAYPFRVDDTTESNIQECLNGLSENYSYNKRKAQSLNKDLWIAIQTHLVGEEKGDSCNTGWGEYVYNNVVYCCSYLDPTKFEVRVQTFLALCYGAAAVMCYKIPYSLDSIWSDPPYLETGLFDQYGDSVTLKWEEIKNFTGPRVEKLGPLITNLTWQGAGFYENLDTVTGSFIDSLKPAPGETLLTTYVEVGFFEDDADTHYFMLVNRQCLENHEQNVTVYMDSASIGNKKMWYVIDQYSEDTTFTGAINGKIPFTTHLAPGEGKLFKLAAFPDSAFHGTAHPLTWQGGIMVDGDVTVDSAKTLVIQPPAQITFLANLDVIQTWDPEDCDFIVYGGLRAVGTEADSIIFTSTGNNPNDWEGIKAQWPTHGLICSYCIIQYAYRGIDAFESYPASITHTRFHNNENGIRDQYNTPIISNNNIYMDPPLDGSSGTGIELWDISYSDSGSIESNFINNYWSGIMAVSCDNIKLYNTTISYTSIGVRSWLCSPIEIDNVQMYNESPCFGIQFVWDQASTIKVKNSTFRSNSNSPNLEGILFYLSDSNSSLRKTIIENFSYVGVRCNLCEPDLGTETSRGYNHILSDSGDYVYYSPNKASTDSLKAQYNWWGEYPPDSTRFRGPVIFMPALTNPYIPDSTPAKIAYEGNTPEEFQLLQNYPNPFNPVTSIQFTVGSSQFPARATLKIYNILGQLVRTLLDEEKSEGGHTVYWDGCNMNGEKVSSGIYFYKLEAGEFREVKKMVLLR